MAPASPNTPVQTEENIKIIKASLDELRLFFQHITNIYDQLRIKCLALIAGEVAIVTLIFAGGFKFPTEYYLQLLFLGGAGCLALAFGFLLWIISSMEWKIPHDLESSHQLEQKHADELSFLEYLHDDYLAVIKHNLPLITIRSKKISWPIYLISLGVTIVLIIKFGG